MKDNISRRKVTLSWWEIFLTGFLRKRDIAVVKKMVESAHKGFTVRKQRKDAGKKGKKKEPENVS